MQMVYAFTMAVAIRSFEEAQRQEPDCAMCYWGEAQALMARWGEESEKLGHNGIQVEPVETAGGCNETEGT